MDPALLKQIGELLLGSVPTILYLLILFAAYTALVHKPLQKVLAERYSLTQGAIEKAKADIAAAEAKTAEYEQRLREARQSVYKQQEARRQTLLDERSKAVAEARAKAEAMVKDAKATIVRDMEAAKSSIQSESEVLANDIVRSILKKAAPAGGRL